MLVRPGVLIGSSVGSGEVAGPGPNLLLSPDELSSAPWSPLRASVSGNAFASPNGTMTAEKLIEDSTANTNHYISQSVSIADGDVYAASVWAHAAEHSQINLRWGTGAFTVGNATFNLSTGAVTGSGSYVNAYAEDWLDGWWRCVLVQQAIATMSGNFRIYLAASGSITLSGENGTRGLYLWRAKIELGNRATGGIEL